MSTFSFQPTFIQMGGGIGIWSSSKICRCQIHFLSSDNFTLTPKSLYTRVHMHGLLQWPCSREALCACAALLTCFSLSHTCCRHWFTAIISTAHITSAVCLGLHRVNIHWCALSPLGPRNEIDSEHVLCTIISIADFLPGEIGATGE